jgi:hypothetical protein
MLYCIWRWEEQQNSTDWHTLSHNTPSVSPILSLSHLRHDELQGGHSSKYNIFVTWVYEWHRGQIWARCKVPSASSSTVPYPLVALIQRARDTFLDSLLLWIESSITSLLHILVRSQTYICDAWGGHKDRDAKSPVSPATKDWRENCSSKNFTWMCLCLDTLKLPSVWRIWLVCDLSAWSITNHPELDAHSSLVPQCKWNNSFQIKINGRLPC